MQQARFHPGTVTVEETLQQQLVGDAGEVDVVEHMDRLQAFLFTGILELADTDSGVRNVVQRHAGIGQRYRRATVGKLGDAVVAAFEQQEVVGLAVEREVGATHTYTGAPQVER